MRHLNYVFNKERLPARKINQYKKLQGSLGMGVAQPRGLSWNVVHEKVKSTFSNADEVVAMCSQSKSFLDDCENNNGTFLKDYINAFLSAILANAWVRYPLLQDFVKIGPTYLMRANNDNVTEVYAPLLFDHNTELPPGFGSWTSLLSGLVQLYNQIGKSADILEVRLNDDGDFLALPMFPNFPTKGIDADFAPLLGILIYSTTAISPENLNYIPEDSPSQAVWLNMHIDRPRQEMPRFVTVQVTLGSQVDDDNHLVSQVLTVR